MKIFKTTLILAVLLALNSCSTDEKTVIEESELKGYLETLNNDYIFYDSTNEMDAINNIPEPIYFDSLEEAKKFLNSVEKFKNNVASMEGPDFTHDYGDSGGGMGGGDDYYRLTFLMSGGFATYMNIGYNVTDCKGSNLNSWISGFTLGVSYDHMGGTMKTNQQNNRIDLYVDGILHYNIFVEGIGTVFSESLTYNKKHYCN